MKFESGHQRKTIHLGIEVLARETQSRDAFGSERRELTRIPRIG